jgi:hypothetical protein
MWQTREALIFLGFLEFQGTTLATFATFEKSNVARKNLVISRSRRPFATIDTFYTIYPLPDLKISPLFLAGR